MVRGQPRLTPAGAFGTCPSCPNNPTAIRNYDGLEFRVTKTQARGWSGSFSYTWSSLWGNYTGLTTTDQIDGGVTGRNSPDTTRSFDEPFYYFGANGKSNDGPLPTDRPNVFKGYGYYTLPWAGKFNANATTFGLFQVAYQGSPMSSFADVGLASGKPLLSPPTSSDVASGLTRLPTRRPASLTLAASITAAPRGSPRPISTCNIRSR